ncbi:toll/interleukin-1 receptor domain-containing protein [Fertoeibacter niger]
MPQSDTSVAVFICYSRRDMSDANALASALEADGFTPLIDHRDLPYGEEWRRELEGLIAGADVVVWLVSPDSALSDWCNWELGEVVRRAKRLVPVVIRPVEPNMLPQALGRLQLLPSTGIYTPEQHFPVLRDTLRADQGWVKQATILGMSAQEWSRSGKGTGNLLRAEALDAAEAWSVNVPRETPAPSSAILEFILASRRAHRKRQRMTVAGSLAVAAIAGLLAFWGLDRAEEAETQRALADSKTRDAIANESHALSALSDAAFARGNTTHALKLALAAWPRVGDEGRPQLKQAIAAMAAALPFHVSRVAFIGHEDRITDAAFAQDGASVVTASIDGTLRIWETTSGQLIRVFDGHDGAVTSVDISPDGTRLVSGSREDNTTRLWDVHTGVPVGEIMRHAYAVQDVAFSPDGTRVVSASIDHTAKIWDASTGLQVGVAMEHEYHVRTVGFNFDGSLVVTSSDDGSARLWNGTTGAPVGDPMRHADWVIGASFSPDGSRVLTFSRDGTARLWDGRTGAELLPPLVHEGQVTHGIFSPTGEMVLTAALDMKVRMWDAFNGGALGNPLDLGEPFIFVAYARSAEVFATISTSGKLRVFASRSAEQIWDTIDLGGRVGGAVFSSVGTKLLAFMADGSAVMLDLATARQNARELVGENVPVVSTAFSPDGKMLVTASFGGAITLFDVVTGEIVWRTAPEGPQYTGVGFSPDGLRIVASTYDKSSHVLDSANGTEMLLLVGHQDIVRSAEFSLSGDSILTASDDGTARLWDARTGKPVGGPIRHDKAVWTARFSPDGKRIVTGSLDHGVRIWDLDSGDQLFETFWLPMPVTHVAFSADGSMIAASTLGVPSSLGHHDKTAGGYVWKVETGTVVAEMGQHDWASSVAFSKDDKRLLTSSRDGTTKLYDVATGAEISLPLFVDSQTHFAVFSPDNRLVATASHDGVARLWEMPADLGQHGFQIACARLGQDTTLDDIQQSIGLEKLVPICGRNGPLPPSGMPLQ